MDDDPLFKFHESRLEAAHRWQKRALKAEHTARMNAVAVDVQGRKNDELKARVAELEVEKAKLESFCGIPSPCTVREAANIYELRVAELEGERAFIIAEHDTEARAVCDLQAHVEELKRAILRAIELNERVPQDKLSTQVVAQRNQLRAALGLIVPDKSGEVGTHG